MEIQGYSGAHRTDPPQNSLHCNLTSSGVEADAMDMGPLAIGTSGSETDDGGIVFVSPECSLY